MAKLPPRIKVFRTRIGFHDWAVATSSQANALEAWDISRNLFATGEAEISKANWDERLEEAPKFDELPWQ
jgi:hypothetical protein